MGMHKKIFYSPKAKQKGDSGTSRTIIFRRWFLSATQSILLLHSTLLPKNYCAKNSILLHYTKKSNFCPKMRFLTKSTFCKIQPILICINWLTLFSDLSQFFMPKIPILTLKCTKNNPTYKLNFRRNMDF